MSQEIDFVITWVDGGDENWRREKAKYSPNRELVDGEERYRDWNILKYWFRGVEKYAPWVRKIHFITWGHLPSWLDTSNPKLHIVKHQDYMPQDILPVFDSNVIEIHMHKIEDLSEHFVYFNDDMFLTKSVKPEDFFCQGKPCDMLAFQPVVANPANPNMSHVYLNNSLVLSKYFEKRENVKKQSGNYFKIGYPPLYFFYNILEMVFPLYTGFYTVHGPASFCKSTFEELWEKEEALLTTMSHNRFRGDNDISQYLFREWQKLSGNFHAKNIQKDFCYFELGKNIDQLQKIIGKQKKKVVCINDGQVKGDISQMKKELQNAFEQILSEKSGFEK